MRVDQLKLKSQTELHNQIDFTKVNNRLREMQIKFEESNSKLDGMTKHVDSLSKLSMELWVKHASLETKL